jgi:hypothetical protein
MNRFLIAALTIAAFAAATTAAAGARGKALKWMDSAGAGLPAGAKLAVLSGNPAKAGPFTLQIRMPADYAVPAHHHPGEEVVRVRSGTLNYGMGDKLDKTNAGTLTDPATHVTMHAGMNHWVFTTAPAVIEVTGAGPFAIVYADPKDDPRTK